MIETFITQKSHTQLSFSIDFDKKDLFLALLVQPL